MLFLDELSSNASGGLEISYQASLATLLSEEHAKAVQRATARDVGGSNTSGPPQVSNENSRARAFQNAHQRALSTPRRTANSFHWCFSWPDNVDPRHINFHHKVCR